VPYSAGAGQDEQEPSIGTRDADDLPPPEPLRPNNRYGSACTIRKTQASPFTYDRYGHLFPEADTMAAAKLEAIRSSGLGARFG
jgi:hypothetical protein